MPSELAKILADFRTQLTAKISVGGTSGAIQTNVDDDAVTIPNGTYYFTIDGDNNQKEYIQCTVTGLNLTAIKSLSRQGVLTSGTVREHRVGAIVTVTDYGIIKKMLDLLDGTTDLDGSNPLKYDTDPSLTDDKEFCTKKYADDLAIAGSPKASDSVYGIAKLSTPAVDPLQPIVVGDNDTRVSTQGENDAQAGTSGNPGATNKFVTENDTSNGSVKTASTISFVAGTKNIADSGSGFITAGFRAGASITVTGSSSNNSTFTIISVSAGAIVVAETITDESAGASVTITTVSANKLARKKSDGNITVPSTPTASTDACSKAYVDLLDVNGFSASDTLQVSADNVAQTNTSTYSLVKEIKVIYGGVIRVKADIKNTNGYNAANYKVYVNGVAVGTEKTSTTDGTYTTVSDDISVGAGDSVQAYLKTDGVNQGYVRNFRIYGTLVKISGGTVIIN